jgi:adenine deaminase
MPALTRFPVAPLSEMAECAIAYMGFNLIPLSVTPAIGITDKGLALQPEMTISPVLEGA